MSVQAYGPAVLAPAAMGAVLAVALSAGPVTAATPKPRPAPKPCPVGLAAENVTRVDSGSARSGASFRFRIVKAGTLLGVRVPAGTIGYGVVREATQAGRRNRDGSLALEARYLVVHGAHLPVAMDPTNPAVWTPRTSLVATALGHVPIPIPGLAMSGINLLRFGKNVTIGPGTYYSVIGVPDLASHGECGG